MGPSISISAVQGLGAEAAQLVAVDGEIRQLVEVKLSVVQAQPTRTIDATCERIETSEPVATALPQPDDVPHS